MEPEAIEQPEAPKSRKLSDEQREKGKGRSHNIRLLMSYYSIVWSTAQTKYDDLRRRDPAALQDILKRAEEGQKGESPVCPRCSSEMMRRLGKYGEFWSCNKYPNCTGTRPIKSEILKVTEDQQKDISRKMELALKFVSDVGGVDEALKYVSLVTNALTDKSEERPR